MSALEKMVHAVLSYMDLDVEAVKTEVTNRIVSFERNVATLNATLISHDAALKNIEKKLDALMVHNGLNPTTEGKANGHGNIVPTIEGPKAGA